MKYLSLFSGIEAATVAWHPLGWEPVAFCEIDKFPSAVLAHRFPVVHNFGDVTAITEEQIKALGRIDLVVFGSPCQDLSVAGKRKGLAGERSGLFHTAIQIIGWARKHCGLRWALWENVPGAFSSNAGADFAAVVEHLAGVALPVPAKGWGVEGVAVGQEGLVEWAVLDAQWFGVAQRRRRVFALADFGDWFSRCPVLLEPHSLRGNFAPSREAGQRTAGAVVARAGRNGGASNADLDAGHILAFGGNNQGGPIDVATARNACASASGRLDFESETFVVGSAVRRLTPRECERLQGFPDDWTLIPWRGRAAEQCPDGPRYKTLGNSMAVPVMRWIGERIEVAGLIG